MGALAVALLLALAILSLLLPATMPLLEEACRGVQRARFWTRFLGLALVLAVPLGVLLSNVTHAPQNHPSVVEEQARGLRAALHCAALVVLLLAVAITASLPSSSDPGRDLQDPESPEPGT